MTYKRLDSQFYESEYERNSRLRTKRQSVTSMPVDEDVTAMPADFPYEEQSK